ncbi:ribonucleotide reductase class Ia beta subunit [Aeromonas phage D3]|uniref:ribonucleoside-diphosphate reductase n=1 Tax=Aeromonas phage D3 TaxID=2593327 RepID=A0A7D6J6T7_9CAUD|nr:ribonucleotide reductase class Ia beta subunit [Aeromonas phage D3]QLM02908.1 putative ribonucleotide-diphosphate reductase subunit beta [Aeromonas phage D3]
MSYSVFNPTQNDQLKEHMFLGQSVNVSRYDQQKFFIFEALIEKQLSFFWRPEEVDVSRDAIDFKALPPHEQHIFKVILGFTDLVMIADTEKVIEEINRQATPTLGL